MLPDRVSNSGPLTYETCSNKNHSDCMPAKILALKVYEYLKQEPEVPGSIQGPATYFRFSFR